MWPWLGPWEREDFGGRLHYAWVAAQIITILHRGEGVSWDPQK